MRVYKAARLMYEADKEHTVSPLFTTAQAMLESGWGTAAIDEHMNEKPTGPVRMVYGIRGVMQLFNCSYSTAQRIKASGQIDGVISQVGRKITVNADRAIELYNLQNNINQ